jgi:formylglycine-generating enzyme required for sulfatase activity
VWEWCLTDFETVEDDADAIEAPALRTLRGGAWFNTPDMATTTARVLGNCHNNTHGRSNGVGFRVVKL